VFVKHVGTVLAMFTAEYNKCHFLINIIIRLIQINILRYQIYAVIVTTGFEIGRVFCKQI